MSDTTRPLGIKDANYHIDPNTYTDEAFQGEYSGENLIYKGFARPGASVDEPVWQIAYLTYDGSGNALTIQWPAQLLTSTRQITNQSIGTVTTPWTAFSGTLSALPIVAGTVVITTGSVTFRDTLKDGTLTGSPGTNSGTIDYDTGDVTLSFSPALGINTSVLTSFQVYGLGTASSDYDFIWSQRHSYTYL